MQTPTPYPALFSPLQLEARTPKNRIVHLAMNTHMASRTRVTEQLIDYHAARARGGAALIVTEPISMARNQNVFDRVIVLTTRDYIAQRTALVTRQGIIRRFHEKQIEVIPLTQPRWAQSQAGRLEYANVYSGAIGAVEDVAFFAYSTPRIPEDTLVAPLRAGGVEVHLAGDCALPQGLLAATRSGHASGMAV